MTVDAKLFLLIYLCVVSFVSFVVTVFDKLRSKKRGARRVPEKTLFLLSVVGGSAAMYLTMCAIRHKTRHKRFMIGIPFIIAVQLGLCYLVMRFTL